MPINENGIQENNIFFTQEVIAEAYKIIPVGVKNFWEIKILTPSHGCIRTLEEDIVAIYFYVDTKIQDNSILKFNYIDNKMEFDSVYVEKNLHGRFTINTEYRYNQYNEIVARYTWIDGQPFCSQNKTGDHTKTYTRHDDPQPAIQSLKDISKYYLTKEIDDELVSCFHTSGNPSDIYWLIT